MRQTIDLTVESSRLAVDALAEASGLPKQRIKDAMAKGACWWTQKGKQVRLRKAKRELKPGTRIQLFYDDQVLARQPEEPELLENKGRYTVWFKPHGLLSQGSQWGDHCSLLRLAETELNKPCFLVHRLDGDAAGIMLIAHDGKASVSRVTTLSYDADSDTTELEVRIETGRKHQIRRHLSGIDHPIVGDKLYGTADSAGLQLTAVELAFHCPLTRKDVVFRLPELSAF